MTALELKQYLEKNLSNLIGTYTTPTGKIYPAIRIYPPVVDQSWKVNGVEISIYETAESSGTEPLIGETLIREWWVVKFVQWDSTKGLAEITDKVKTLFPKVTIVSKPPTIDTFQSAIMTIYDPKFLGACKQWNF